MFKVDIFTRTPTSGGKAGKGYNRTSSVQVCERMGKGYRVIKIFRYRIGNKLSILSAQDKAIFYEMKIRRSVQELNKLMRG